MYLSHEHITRVTKHQQQLETLTAELSMGIYCDLVIHFEEMLTISSATQQVAPCFVCTVDAHKHTSGAMYMQLWVTQHLIDSWWW